jgi:lipopolysaccharide biosynthesis glycosyltransferase
MQKELQPIEISLSFVISDNYSQHLAVVIASILKNAGPKESFVFHVLTTYLSEENQTRLQQFAKDDTRCRVVFHVIDGKAFDAFPLPIEHVSIEMYYRYLLPTLLQDEKRTIYMDVDILVHQSLRELFELDLGDCLIAGVNDFKEETPGFLDFKEELGMKRDAKYFNSGVLVMDIARLREDGFTQKCMEKTIQHSAILSWPDQDIINLVMEGRIYELPVRFNCIMPERLPMGDRIVIEHFASFSSKPWCCLPKNTTWPIYLRYLRTTPYRDKAWAFIWSHIKGVFYFRYTKKNVERILVFGIRVWRRKCY